MRFVKGLLLALPIYVLGFMALLAAWANVAILMEARRLGIEMTEKQLAQGLVGIVMSLLPAAFVFIPVAHRWLYARRDKFGADVLFRGMRLLFFYYVTGRYAAKEPFIGIEAIEGLSRSGAFIIPLVGLYFIFAVLPGTYGSFLNPPSRDRRRPKSRDAVEKDLHRRYSADQSPAQPTYRGNASATGGERISSLEDAQAANDPLARARASGRLREPHSPTRGAPEQTATVLRRGEGGPKPKRPPLLRRIVNAPFWRRAPRWVYLLLLALSMCHWTVGYYAISPPRFIPNAESLALNDALFPYLAATTSVTFLLGYLGLVAHNPDPARKLTSIWTSLMLIALTALTVWMSSFSVSRGVLALASRMESGVPGVTTGDVTGRDFEASAINDCEYRARTEFAELDEGAFYFYVCLEDRAAYDAASAGGRIRLEGEVGEYGFRYERATLVE